MKFFKLIICLLKRWKVLLTLVSVLGFAYCGSVNQGQRADYTWSASTSGDYTGTVEGGRVSQSGGASIGSSQSREKKPSQVLIDNFVEQASYFYTVRGRCTTESQAAVFGPCFLNCLDTHPVNSAEFDTCETACETASPSCEGAGGHLGSGFFYNTDKVLTNHHVVAEKVTYTIDSNGDRSDRFPNQNNDPEGFYFSIVTLVENHAGTRKNVDSVEWHNRAADVAMTELASDMPGAESVTLGSLRDVTRNSPVFTIGSPRGFKWIASQGEITGSGTGAANNPDFFIYTSIQTEGGNSGGGIFDLFTGKIIGIIHSTTWQREQNSRTGRLIRSGRGTDVDKIKELIASNGGGRQSTPPVNTQSQRFFENMSEDDRTQAYRRIVEYVRENYDRR